LFRFSADPDLLTEFKKEYLPLATTNGLWTRGDGVKMARKIGAELIHMEHVQLHPTSLIDPENITSKTKFLAPESMRGHGGILLDQHLGVRFTNELETRANVTEAILKHSAVPATAATQGSGSAAFMVLTEEAVQLFDPAVIGFYLQKGFFKKVHGLAELVDLLHQGFCGMTVPKASVAALTAEFNDYNAIAAAKGTDRFGKTVFPVQLNSNGALYVCGITPAIHYTMGGVRINAAAEVLKPYEDPLAVEPRGLPIPGLFAAGEVSGGTISLRSFNCRERSC
jgi:cleavage and polyadenylation specificity factor subunit 2/mediator of RNA polymerase II transcription subunit 4